MRLVFPILLILAPLGAAQRTPLLPGIPVVETPSVLFHGKLSNATKGFEDTLDPGDLFGAAVAAIGDLDGNGVEDIAVGAPGDDDGGGIEGARGAVYVLLRRPDGSVRARQKISAWAGDFPPAALPPTAFFGQSIAGLGDLDGDGVEDIAVGAKGISGAGIRDGVVWLLFLRANGRVKRAVQIDRSTPGVVAGSRFTNFGGSLASPGDWNGDGTPDLALGDNGSDHVMWLLFLEPDGTLAGSCGWLPDP